MSIKRFLSVALLTVVLAPRAFASDLPTVPYVDLERYMGRWFSIASLPQWFERDCFGTNADYALRDDGKVDVVNSCNKGSLDGPLEVANGVARVVDTETNARLAVTFFWPFEGDYWILALADDYSHVLVGTPDRESLWILSRTPTLSDAIVVDLLTLAENLGFDTDAVRTVPQRP
jgi:apolipoprotein D and lipocalin family protein